MKKRIMIIAVLALTLGACSNSGETTVRKDDKIQSLRDYDSNSTIVNPKRKIAIAQFKNQTRFGSKSLDQKLITIMTTELRKSNRFIVLDRSDLGDVMQEINFSNTLGQGKLASERKFQDADYIITGSITKYANNTVGNQGFLSHSKKQTAEVSFDLKMLDVRTGEVVLADQGEGRADKKLGTTLGMGTSGGYDTTLENDALRAAAIKVTDNIIKTIDKTQWMANVVGVSGSDVYIKVGKDSNLPIGTKLEVFKQGEKIEFNGEFLGFKEKKVGEATVSGYSGDKITILKYNGTNFTTPAIVKIAK